MLRAFSHLALLALALLLLPPHSLFEFESHKFFRVARRLGKVEVVVLPEVWEQ